MENLGPQPEFMNEAQAQPDGAGKPGAATKGLKQNAGFSVDEDDWTRSIPAPGEYDAVVAASINPQSDVTWLNIEYQFTADTGQTSVVGEMLALDAKPTSSRYGQSAKGKGRVKAIMEANGKPLKFADIQSVPIELRGCRVRIAIGHKHNNGLPSPVVMNIVGPVPSQEDM